MSENCLIIAGEKSGEEHAMTFLPKLMKEGNYSFWGVGGEDFKENGIEILYHLKEFSSMGISEVIGRIPFYYKAMNRIVDEVKKRGTKKAILIDFQTFNLSLAQKLIKLGVVVEYYVAPQAWVWKAYRSRILAKTVNTLYCILPFEKKWFLDRGVKQVVSVDHPLWRNYCEKIKVEEIKARQARKPRKLLLLPGSRKFEIELMLPQFVKAVEVLKEKYDLEISIVKARHLDNGLYKVAERVVDQIYTDEQLDAALRETDMSIASSGTVTLATGLFGVPTIVCYRGSLLNEWVYNTVVSYTGLVSLTNLILGKEVFPEFIQERMSSFNILNAANKWLEDDQERKKVLDELLRLNSIMKETNDDSAEILLERMEGQGA